MESDINGGCDLMKQLELVKSTITQYLDNINNPRLDMFRADFTFGKMLRSKLILTIAPDSPQSIKLCAIIELIHFASLLHDDVIDNSILRRGKQSINAKYGDKNAIMLGDILYSKAFYEISMIDSRLSSVIADCVLRLSLGELEDVALAENINLDENKYLKMIEYKTAALIETSAFCAGILINENSDKYKIYGNSLGIGFQIIDDLLDITLDDSKLGKSGFSDFKEGKMTLPYIYLYQAMNKDEQENLLSYFKQEIDISAKQWIVEKMQKYHIFSQIKHRIESYKTKALSVLDKEDSTLKMIISDMLDREF